MPYGRHAGGDAEVVLKRSAARSAAEPPLGDAKGRLGRLISRSECGAPGGVRARANNKAASTEGEASTAPSEATRFAFKLFEATVQVVKIGPELLAARVVRLSGNESEKGIELLGRV